MRAVCGTPQHDGRRLRSLRKSCGLSQTRLAEMAGVGRHTVVRWEGKVRIQR
ncbi:MAG: helix-turn-helix domain-containing protein, partial [Alphaproteobacteria bacterium]|nr:helix-turn-helix domain-containing protein [Alphaproteobacteria bacterium]